MVIVSVSNFMPRKFDNFEREIVKKSTKVHEYRYQYLSEKADRTQETLAESKQCYIPIQPVTGYL